MNEKKKMLNCRRYKQLDINEKKALALSLYMDKDRELIFGPLRNLKQIQQNRERFQFSNKENVVRTIPYRNRTIYLVPVSHKKAISKTLLDKLFQIFKKNPNNTCFLIEEDCRLTQYDILSNQKWTR